MRATGAHLTCTTCRHPIPDRSERCDVEHPLCTSGGCTVPRQFATSAPRLDREAVEAMAPRLLSTPNRLVDLASYQDGINLATVLTAGFTAVNIKLTQGNWYTWSRGKAYADTARALGMAISTFSWIDNSASGRVQADYAYAQMKAIGGPAGMVHQCDCEDSARPATWEIVRDYVGRMRELLGRPIVLYTGDWWWQPRGWNGASLTPYVWAAPNDGYLSSYPGDQSGAWRAGYGGWGDYSILQYAVQAVAGAGGGNLSKSAIRDPQVWAALSGGSSNVAVTQADADLIARTIMAYRVGGPRNPREFHYAVSDLRDMLVTDPPGSSYDGQVYGVVKRVDALLDAAAADQARDAGMLAAINALAAQITAGGGNVDTAAIVAAVQAAAADTRGVVQQLRADLAAAEQRERTLEQRLADALHNG